MGIRDLIRSLYETDSEKTLRIEAEESQTLEEAQEHEEELRKARESWERENDHVPAIEYYSCSSEVILRVIEEHRRALNNVLKFEDLLDCYVADLETKIPYYRTRKQLYNWLQKFPGAQATMDKVREEIEELTNHPINGED